MEPEGFSVDELRDGLLKALRGNDGSGESDEASVWELPPGLEDASQLDPASVAVLAKSGAVTASAALVLGVELAVTALRQQMHEARLVANSHASRTSPSSSSVSSGIPEPSSRRGRDAATQVTTVSGIVLSRHVLEKCVLRYRMHELEHRCATLIAQCDALTRELIRTCATPTLIGTVTAADETVRGSAALRPFWMDVPRQVEAQVQRWKHLVQRHEASLALTRSERAVASSAIGRAGYAGVPVQAPRFHLHRDTTDILQRWDDALRLVTVTSATCGNPHLRWTAEDDDDDGGVAATGRAEHRDRGDDVTTVHSDRAHGFPKEGSTSRGPRAPSARCEPIFLCRRCRQDARATMEYDEDAHRMNFHVQRTVAEKPLAVALPHLDPSPPPAALLTKPGRGAAVAGALVPVPVKPSLKQRNEPPQRKWESTTHGIRVNLR